MFSTHFPIIIYSCLSYTYCISPVLSVCKVYRRGRLEGSLEILYKNSNRTEAQMVRPDKWWEQRESVVRSLIYKKRFLPL